MMIKFSKHFINYLLTFRMKNLLNIHVKLKLIKKIYNNMKKLIHMFNNVNKSYVLQRIF
jgi:hypothetical protein